MANTAAKKITYDGKPVQVESAIRDGSGKVISSTYAPKFTVTDSNPTLAWGTKSKVATVAGTAINVTMPANPTTGLVTGVSSVNTKTGAVTLSASDVGALPSSTKYAGSSSAGGAATTALACTGNSATATNAASTATTVTNMQLRNIKISTAAPTSSDGANGDIWIQYAE